MTDPTTQKSWPTRLLQEMIEDKLPADRRIIHRGMIRALIEDIVGDDISAGSRDNKAKKILKNICQESDPPITYDMHCEAQASLRATNASGNDRNDPVSDLEHDLVPQQNLSPTSDTDTGTDSRFLYPVYSRPIRSTMVYNHDQSIGTMLRDTDSRAARRYFRRFQEIILHHVITKVEQWQASTSHVLTMDLKEGGSSSFSPQFPSQTGAEFRPPNSKRAQASKHAARQLMDTTGTSRATFRCPSCPRMLQNLPNQRAIQAHLGTHEPSPSGFFDMDIDRMIILVRYSSSGGARDIEDDKETAGELMFALQSCFTKPFPKKRSQVLIAGRNVRSRHVPTLWHDMREEKRKGKKEFMFANYENGQKLGSVRYHAAIGEAWTRDIMAQIQTFKEHELKGALVLMGLDAFSCNWGRIVSFLRDCLDVLPSLDIFVAQKRGSRDDGLLQALCSIRCGGYNVGHLEAADILAWVDETRQISVPVASAIAA